MSTGGEVEAEPDQAVVDVGVQATGESADGVTDELATGATRLRETFDELGIAEENVEEGQYRIHQVRGQDSGRFRGSHSFEVTVADVDRVGEVVDASIRAGADDVGRVHFTLQEETRSSLRKTAIDAALANADEEATHIAANRQVSLEGTTAVTTGDGRVHPARESLTGADVADEQAPPTEIEADPVSVHATVTVTYSFAE